MPPSDTGPAFIPATPSPSRTLEALAPFLNDLIPLLTHRVLAPHPPPVLPSSTVAYLTSLPSQTLSAIDHRGAIAYLADPHTHAPPYLHALAQHASLLSASFPTLPPPPASSPAPSPTRLRPRKRAQVLALARLLDCVCAHSNPTRVLDLAAGHAHLSAYVAASQNLPVRALELDQRMLHTARRLHSHPNFEALHVDLRDNHLQIDSRDALIALHPCGHLGDTFIRLAAEHRPAVALLVSCCLQKLLPLSDSRHPLSNIAKSSPLAPFFALPRSVLGASNRPRTAPTAAAISARVTRHALRTLLQDRGVTVAAGDEVRGVSRHVLPRGLAYVAPAVTAMHGVPGPLSEHECRHRMRRAHAQYHTMRALSVPRVLAGQALEMAIVLDRAAALEDAAFSNVRTCRLWPAHISPRNLCCVAW